MPYSGPDDPTLPQYVKDKPADQRAQWVAVWEKEYSKCEGEGRDGCEGRAFRMANGVTDNCLLLANAEAAAKAYHKEFDGKGYLIVPAVPVRQTVMNGEFVPGDEIGRYVEAWNGIPLTLDHPQDGDGDFISANSPEIEALSPGRLYNAALAGDPVTGDLWLKADLWLDAEKTKRLGGDALKAYERFEAGLPVELSTGYFRDLEERPGVYNGVDYYGIARNLRPDHLAILLHEEGACSWRDGCGAPRLNLRANQDYPDTVWLGFDLTPEQAKLLQLSPDQLPEGSKVTPTKDLHLTLAIGEISDQDHTPDEIYNLLKGFALSMPPIVAEIGGLAQFNTEQDDNLQVLVAIIDCNYLQNWRRRLVKVMDENNINLKWDFGYVPHITLARVPAGQLAAVPVPEKKQVVFGNLVLDWGLKTKKFRLQGLPESAESLIKNSTSFENSTEATMDRNQLIAQIMGHERNKLSENVVNMMGDEELAAIYELLMGQPAAMANQPPPDADAGTPPAAPPAAQEGQPAPNAEPGLPGAPPAAPSDPATVAGGGSLGELAEQVKKMSSILAGLVGMNKRFEAVEATVTKLNTTIQAGADKEKNDLISYLAANSLTTLPEAALKKLDVSELQALVPANYAGLGIPRVNAAANGFDHDGTKWESVED